MGWPKSSFGFFRKMLWETQMNFWANPILLQHKLKERGIPTTREASRREVLAGRVGLYGTG